MRRSKSTNPPESEKQQPPTFVMPGFYEDPEEPPRTIECNGQEFLVFRMHTSVLFRPKYRDEWRWEWTYFLDDRLASPEEWATYDATEFTIRYAASAYGRCLFYCWPDGWHCGTMLCFRQDGTGYFEEWNDLVEFTYYREWADLRLAGDILSLPAEELQPLAYDVFTHQVLPAMRDPYLRDVGDLKAVPLEFICGSEQELAQLTRWILHTEPSLFGKSPPATLNLHFRAATNSDRDGVSALFYGSPVTHRLSERLKALCDLAFEYNTFIGTSWEYNDERGNRRSGYDEYPLDVGVEIRSPSRQEEEEARERLYEWLTGKVSPEERDRLLNLS